MSDMKIFLGVVLAGILLYAVVMAARAIGKRIDKAEDTLPPPSKDIRDSISKFKDMNRRQ